MATGQEILELEDRVSRRLPPVTSDHLNSCTSNPLTAVRVCSTRADGRADTGAAFGEFGVGAAASTILYFTHSRDRLQCGRGPLRHLLRECHLLSAARESDRQRLSPAYVRFALLLIRRVHSAPVRRRRIAFVCIACVRSAGSARSSGEPSLSPNATLPSRRSVLTVQHSPTEFWCQWNVKAVALAPLEVAVVDLRTISCFRCCLHLQNANE